MKNLPYIALEGIDGAGKSTQIELLTKHLDKLGIRYRVLHFTKKSDNILGRTILCLYGSPNTPFYSRFFQRFEIIQLILFALNARINFRSQLKDCNNSQLLIGDRSVITAYVFHYELLKKYPSLWKLEPTIIPNDVLLFEIEPALAFNRIRSRPEIGHDETLEIIEKLHQRYKRLASEEPVEYFRNISWHIINAERPTEDICIEIIAWVKKFI